MLESSSNDKAVSTVFDDRFSLKMVNVETLMSSKLTVREIYYFSDIRMSDDVAYIYNTVSILSCNLSSYNLVNVGLWSFTGLSVQE